MVDRMQGLLTAEGGRRHAVGFLYHIWKMSFFLFFSFFSFGSSADRALGNFLRIPLLRLSRPQACLSWHKGNHNF